MRYRPHYLLLASVLFGTAISAAYLSVESSRRTWAAEEVPIAFWAWKNSAPSETEISDARRRSGVGDLFVWAGQLDLIDGEVVRDRQMRGYLPNAVKVHLVYNGTRKLLDNLGSTDPEMLAEAIAKTYLADLGSQNLKGVKAVGIQLDLDYPTRLLPRYGETIRRLREKLPPATIISVTGLPTWMNNPEISKVLDAVDLWTPQLYGAEIPTRIDKPIPISSTGDIRRWLGKIRKLNKPFYAGLAAYGYTILYDRSGDLVSLRGDIDLSSILSSVSLEFVRQENLGGNVRYIFRARSDLVLDSLVIAKGESLVFDTLSPASLREAARAVREEAGDRLLGICVFRLPTADDRTNLRLGEIVDALRDRPMTSDVGVSVEKASDRKFTLSAVNHGSASSLAQNALTIDLYVPPGSVRGVTSISGFYGYEPMCAAGSGLPRKCSSGRADVIRLTKNSWRPGDEASICLIANWQPNDGMTAFVTTRDENGRTETASKKIAIGVKDK